jgi:mercuric ion transport protein
MSIGKLAGTSAITAIAASLCCVAPMLALLAGTGGIAASFSWIAPARPYLIVLTIIVLIIAWYQKLKPQATDDCGCVADHKPGFLQSKAFLLLVTLFAALMVAFPFYAKAFFPKDRMPTTVTEGSNIQTVELNIEGMTCEACEAHVKKEVNKLPGIIRSVVSYEKKNAHIQFDTTKTAITDIVNAVHKTGYKVTNHSIKNKAYEKNRLTCWFNHTTPGGCWFCSY